MCIALSEGTKMEVLIFQESFVGKKTQLAQTLPKGLFQPSPSCTARLMCLSMKCAHQGQRLHPPVLHGGPQYEQSEPGTA